MAVYQSGHIRNMISVSEPDPWGQYISMAIVEYDCEIAGDSLRPEQFSVAGREITKIYANQRPEKASQGGNGRFVILELSAKDADAPMLRFENECGRVLESPPPPDCYAVRAENRLEVVQCGTIAAADGGQLPPVAERIASSEGRNLVVDDFRQFQYEDISFSLYIPEKYSSGSEEEYPLVLFLPDASVLGNDPLLPLLQGTGATAFASERDQRLHPSFVLTPALPFSYKITSKVGIEGAGRLVNRLAGLLDHVCARYRVDSKRIYVTGQSFGCIASCVLNVCCPERFAASLLVAGQWDAGEMSALSRKNLWLITSDGDARAYPSMNAMADAWKSMDAGIGIWRWDAKAGADALSALARQAAAEKCNIHYTIFENSSVVPEGVEATPITNHVNTWPRAYSIDAIRDWLFTNSL